VLLAPFRHGLEIEVEYGMRSRAPAVAGTFYSAKPQELAAAVRSFMAGASLPDGHKPPKAVIAPHAGYIYSGPIAGSAYAALSTRGKDIERVVVVGPSHRVAFDGIAASSAGAFDTPLGPIGVDREAVALLVKEGAAREFDRAHENEHSLEVQLPFIKLACPDARVVPLLAGDDDWHAAMRALALLWGGDETAVVVSSDLSHYRDDATAKELDAATAKAVESLAAGEIGFEQACGATGINAVLALASQRHLTCTTLDLRNSADTAGPRDRVVGYGAFMLA
jgi:AmmeMemoRadiSam system protein B